MGHCPACGTALNSPREVSRMLGVSASRVRGMLSQHPQRLEGRRVGRHWVIPAQAAKSFQPQPHGVRLPADQDAETTRAGGAACPGCGEALLSVKQAAQALGRSVFYVYGVLDQGPERLQAFRVGRRWVILKRGVERFKKNLAAREKILEAPVSGSQEIEIVVKPEKCNCGAYPFPHRKGGGKCKFAVRRGSRQTVRRGSRQAGRRGSRQAAGSKGLSEAQRRLYQRIKKGSVDPEGLNHLEKRSLDALLRKGRVEIDAATGRLKLTEP